MNLVKTTTGRKMWNTALRGATALITSVTLAAAMGGCDYWNLRNSFLDPSQVGRFDRDTPWGLVKAPKPPRWPILTTLGVMDEPELAWQNATDPVPGDLVVHNDEQTIQPGDAVHVSIFELVAPGQEAVTEGRVDDLGNLTIKNLNKVNVTGLTASQLEAKISQMLVTQLILPKDPPPQVNVLLLESRSRVYYLMGSASRPGTYTIQGNDFRLLEALALAGDIPVQSGMDYLYIIRQTEYDDKSAGASQTTTTTQGGGTTVPANTGNPLDTLEKLQPNTSQPSTTPTSGPATLQSAQGPQLLRPLPMSMMVASGGGGAAGAPYQVPATNFDGALNMPGASTSAPATTGGVTTANWPATTSSSASATGAATGPVTSEPATYINGKWAPTQSDLKQTRVIRIPIKELREGVSKYNIVIRPGDIINAPTLDLGEFYLMGNIARPGVYSLTGRKITLRQAVAAGGNLGPLAMPRRCELIRRINGDTDITVQVNLQKIFDADAPDIFLKPNDVLNIGTDMIAPFVAVTRNAYRASYGWGFIYDKNFNTSNGGTGQ